MHSGPREKKIDHSFSTGRIQLGQMKNWSVLIFIFSHNLISTYQNDV